MTYRFHADDQGLNALGNLSKSLLTICNFLSIDSALPCQFKIPDGRQDLILGITEIMISHGHNGLGNGRFEEILGTDSASGGFDNPAHDIPSGPQGAAA